VFSGIGLAYQSSKNNAQQAKILQTIIGVETMKDAIEKDTLKKPTERELEILLRVANGNTSAQTALELNISVKTVETHKKNLQRKFDALNGCHLVYKMAKAGII